MKQFRFRALVTFDSVVRGCPARQYSSGTRALMVHTRRPGETGGHLFFPAVITRDDEKPLQPGTHTVVTITLTSDGAEAPLEAGQHFAVWNGDDMGHGIISRQVFTAFGPS